MRTVVLALAFLLVAAPRPARACDCTTTGMKHVYLHYDYMVAADHTHEPDPAAIAMVVEAYKQHGIRLHIDPQHDAIPEARVISFDGFAQTGCFPGATRFEDLKGQYFRPTHADEHYAIFAHNVWCDSLESCGRCNTDYTPFGWSSGIGGSDFAVTLGVFTDFAFPVDALMEGGVFMHELGHNLGLLHGGDEHLDFKPNYLSVMNNNFITVGIRSAATPGSAVVAATRLDYSSVALQSLDESALDESRGLGAGSNDITSYLCLYPCGGTLCFEFRDAPASGPVDWSCENGIDAAPVSEDISGDGQMSVLHGFDDWAEIRHFLDHPRSLSKELREPGMRAHRR